MSEAYFSDIVTSTSDNSVMMKVHGVPMEKVSVTIYYMYIAIARIQCWYHTQFNSDSGINQITVYVTDSEA